MRGSYEGVVDAFDVEPHGDSLADRRRLKAEVVEVERGALLGAPQGVVDEVERREEVLIDPLGSNRVARGGEVVGGVGVGPDQVLVECGAKVTVARSRPGCGGPRLAGWRASRARSCSGQSRRRAELRCAHRRCRPGRANRRGCRCRRTVGTKPSRSASRSSAVSSTTAPGSALWTHKSANMAATSARLPSGACGSTHDRRGSVCAAAHRRRTLRARTRIRAVVDQEVPVPRSSAITWSSDRPVAASSRVRGRASLRGAQ